MFKTIKSRLLVVVLLPLTFMGMEAAKSWKDAAETAGEMSAIQAYTTLAIRTSSLIHETQKERGYSAGYMKSGGTIFKEELESQRQITDAHVASLTAYINEFDFSTQTDKFAAPFQAGMGILGKLEERRAQISDLSIPATEAIAFYTQMHAQLLESIAAIAHQSNEPHLTQSINSFATFLQGKERAGIVRALLSGALASDRLEGPALKKLTETVAMEQEYYRIFARTATTAELEFFHAYMAKPEVQLAEDMVAEAFDLAMNNQKPEYYRKVAEALSPRGPLGSAIQSGTDAQQATVDFVQVLQEYSELPNVTDAEREKLTLLELLVQDYPTGTGASAGWSDWSNQVAQAMTPLAEGQFALGSTRTAPEWFEASTDRLRILKDIELDFANSLSNGAQTLKDQANSELALRGILGSICMLLVAISGIWIFRSVMKRIRQLTASIEEVDAKQDLTLLINDTARDELTAISNSFDTLLTGMYDTLKRVGGVTESLADGAAQVGSSSQSLAVGATQQAANLQSISAQVSGILEQTQRNTESAQTATALAQASEACAERGMEQVRNMSEAMDEISASSKRISEIIKTIDELAFQTNLLALNANVEAARAGEAGKGFAVVAEEVRNLAKRSAQAASDTASVILESQQCASKGVSIASQARVALEEISNGANQVNDILASIAAASLEQTEAIAGVNRGISELDDVTQYNAAHSEELAAAADQTSCECKTLEGLISRFHVGHGGGQASESKSNPMDPTQEQSLSVGLLDEAPAIQPQSTFEPDMEACMQFDDGAFDDGLESF
ncbi:MAG: methyl-accepting chemotaxis protein [Planctomycetes bacterium]|nr:methyl-accepting chemotaxis protein [Planctomycetota bacterium]